MVTTPDDLVLLPPIGGGRILGPSTSVTLASVLEGPSKDTHGISSTMWERTGLFPDVLMVLTPWGITAGSNV